MDLVRGRRSVEGLLVDWAVEQPLPDRRLPVALLSKAQKAAELQRVQVRRAMDAAYEAELVMGLADDTPDTPGPEPDHPGARSGSWAPATELPGVSEFFTAEPVATPSGVTRTTGPPGTRPPRPPEPPEPPETVDRPPATPPDDDPPPF